MNISEDILIFLSGYHKGYALMRKRLRGYTGPATPLKLSAVTEIKTNTLRITLSRLKKRGLATNNKDGWIITPKGKELIKNKIDKFSSISPFMGRLFHIPYQVNFYNKKKSMIIAFDIPETHKKVRNWLRIELVNLGFSQLQKSVWFGASPLPQEFIERISDLHILPYIKFFRASEYDIV
ncbi:MAG: hypothetical protein Q8P97_01805 [bacterium]|nr:hypothetical protein [bacterium]